MSYDDDQLQHGMMTYHFLEAIRGNADLDKSGYISLSEIFKYADPKVEEYSQKRKQGKLQTPRLIGKMDLAKHVILARVPEHECESQRKAKFNQVKALYEVKKLSTPQYLTAFKQVKNCSESRILKEYLAGEIPENVFLESFSP